MNHSFFKLNSIDVQGQRTLIKTDVVAIADEYLNNKYLGLFPRGNILLFRSNQLKNKLKESFPKIQNIEVEVKDAEYVVITIGERSAHSLWCIDREYESVFDEECYFADQGGILYARAPYFSGNVYLKLFMQPIPEMEYIGTNLNETLDFDSFFRFMNELESHYLLRADRIYFDEFDDVRIRLARLQNVIYDEKEVYISYSSLDDYEIILRNIGLTLDFNEFKKEFNDRPQSLKSIDVRFDGRIFYTFTPIDSEL